MATTISLTFDGYWREGNHGGIPAVPGVYCAYTCVYNNAVNTVTLRKLIYIGESENAMRRVSTHDRWPNWQAKRGPGEVICFTFAPITQARERGEAAMIFRHKPPLNEEYKYRFPFDLTTMALTGQVALLDPYFTVQRTVEAMGYW